MNWFNELDDWGSKSHGAFIFMLRILLGMVLIIRGYLFMFHMDDLIQLIEVYGMGSFTVILAQTVAIIHLAGGLFILTGLVTRISCLTQFPFLVGAVFFTNLRTQTITSSEWLLSIVTLGLLVFFFVHGAGKLSVYNLLVKDAKPEIEEDKDVENAW